MLAWVDAQVRAKTELGKEAERYTHAGWEAGADLLVALELINPAYREDQARSWLEYCFNVVGTLRDKNNGEDMTAQDWAEIDPSLDQVFDNAPVGLSWEQFIQDMNAAEDKMKRTA